MSPWCFRVTLVEKNTLLRGGEGARSLVQGEVLKVLERLEQSLGVLLDFPKAREDSSMGQGRLVASLTDGAVAFYMV